MDVQISQVGDLMVVALAGEIDGRTAPAIQEQLLPLAQPGCKILLDMSGVSYLSSAGLRLLLVLYRQINDNHGRVVLAGLREPIRDTMAITGFLDFFATYGTSDEGAAALKSDAAD
ncbi:MAG: anti-sigma factor antagonist [Chloroflexi bacterium]|nr:anti-sigma factor antagonist [Chloroflexota bacterium]MCI0577599.1 anti-sigma factor antagonist [Chloroflexota bacterium]MCI0644181.1 anti-sigma factor antagonist [Chloroflexota bacterium]MCI0725236.1 anti-sigma factor antagonist [Chloroflexota bacterium]